MGLRSRAGLLVVYLCWFSVLCTWPFFFRCFDPYLCQLVSLTLRPAWPTNKTLQSTITAGGNAVVFGVIMDGFSEGNFIPVSYTCIPFQQLSSCFAPHSVLSGVACSKRAHTQIHTHAFRAPSKRRGRECHPPLAQSFFTGVKVSDSFRVLRTDDYIWSQLNEKSEAVQFLRTLLHW